MTERNIDEIRRKNLADNQLFLEKLRISKIQKDLIKSARTIVQKNDKQPREKILHEKVERVTRYSLKVKSGEIQPWEGRITKKKKGQPSKWTLFYKNNANPYERGYKPRIRN